MGGCARICDAGRHARYPRFQWARGSKFGDRLRARRHFQQCATTRALPGPARSHCGDESRCNQSRRRESHAGVGGTISRLGPRGVGPTNPTAPLGRSGRDSPILRFCGMTWDDLRFPRAVSRNLQSLSPPHSCRSSPSVWGRKLSLCLLRKFGDHRACISDILQVFLQERFRRRNELVPAAVFRDAALMLRCVDEVSGQRCGRESNRTRCPHVRFKFRTLPGDYER